MLGIPLRFTLFNSFLRIFFNLLYHQFAWTYDWVASVVSAGMWRDWVFSVMPFLQGTRILEVGHGPGHLQVALNTRGAQVYGLDESLQMGSQAYQKLIRSGYPPLLVRSNAQNIPFSSDAFDQVVSTFPTISILDHRTWAEVNRVLIPGGMLIVLPVAWITGSTWYERFAAQLFRVSGQAPDMSPELYGPFDQAGFHIQVEKIDIKSSQVLIIQATKPC